MPRLIEVFFRQPVAVLSASLRSTDRWSRRNRRLGQLCDVGDLLGVVRPSQWAERQRRLYLHVFRRAKALGGEFVPRATAPAARDLAREARRAMRQAPSPLRESLRAAGALGVVVGGLASAIVLLASVVSPSLRRHVFPPDWAGQAHWKASSAFPNTPIEGTRASSSEPFFVHTDFQDNPHMIFDFGRPVPIGRVRIRNRADCCQERTLPLNVEIPDATEPKGWRLICQRRTPFSTWTCDPSATVAAKLRIRIPGSGALHLKSVEVFP